MRSSSVTKIMILARMPQWVLLVVLGSSTVVCILGIIGYLTIPSIIQTKISEQLRLIEDSPTLSKWANVDVPIYFSVFLFNITNPEDFAVGKKPIVNELGPYAFSQRRRKIITSIDKDTVTYKDYRCYHFVPERSNGSLSDRLYMLNVPLVAVDKLVRAKLPPFVSKSLVRTMLGSLIEEYNETLVVQRNASEMLFGGYETPMLVELMKQASAFMSSTEASADVSRFGLFYNQNDTAQHWLKVGTGAGNYPIGKVIEWNNRTSLRFWGEQSCNQINGTDGGQFSPGVRIDQKVFVFVTTICRSIYMKYAMDTQVNDVDTMRFTIPGEIYESAKQREENRCFCEARDSCPEGGLMPVSACNRGAPIMFSAPHFYRGSATLVQDVDGVRPERIKHETFLDIHSMTGLVLRGTNRLQINVDLKQGDLLYPLANVTSRVIPLAWVEESMEATKSMTDALREQLIRPEQVAMVVASSAALGGAIGAIAALVVITMKLTGPIRTSIMQSLK